MALTIGEKKDELRFDKTNVKADEMYAGVKGGFGQLTFGRQYLFADDAGIGVDYENKEAGIDFDDTLSDSYIKYQYATPQFEVGLDTL